MKTKLIAILMLSVVIVGFLFGSCGCAGSKNVSAYDHGVEMVNSLLKMLNNEKYSELYNLNTTINDFIANQPKADSAKPKDVYEIIVSDEDLLELSGVEVSKDFPDDLKNDIIKKAYRSFATLLNNYSSNYMYTYAAAIFNIQSSFPNSKITENTIYLYTYKDTLPAIVVFIPEGNGSVSAACSFIFNENMKCDSLSGISQYFSEIKLNAIVRLVEN